MVVWELTITLLTRVRDMCVALFINFGRNDKLLYSKNDSEQRFNLLCFISYFPVIYWNKFPNFLYTETYNIVCKKWSYFAYFKTQSTFVQNLLQFFVVFRVLLIIYRQILTSNVC